MDLNSSLASKAMILTSTVDCFWKARPAPPWAPGWRPTLGVEKKESPVSEGREDRVRGQSGLSSDPP